MNQLTQPTPFGVFATVNHDQFRHAARKPESLAAVLADGLSRNVKFARKPEAVRLRLAIRDIPSGRIGTIDLPLTSPASGSSPE